MSDLVDEPFYTDALTCKLCLVHCRVEERRKIEKELGCSLEEAYRKLHPERRKAALVIDEDLEVLIDD